MVRLQADLNAKRSPGDAQHRTGAQGPGSRRLPWAPALRFAPAGERDEAARVIEAPKATAP